MNARISEAIRRSAAIPSLPQVVTRFLEVISDPNFQYDDVVKVLSADAGTVSEILRLANSALFGLSRKVTSLRQAYENCPGWFSRVCHSPAVISPL